MLLSFPYDHQTKSNVMVVPDTDQLRPEEDYVSPDAVIVFAYSTHFSTQTFPDFIADHFTMVDSRAICDVSLRPVQYYREARDAYGMP